MTKHLLFAATLASLLQGTAAAQFTLTGLDVLQRDGFKALPARLELTWYSLTEDRFYAGRFELPVARLAAFFDRGAAAPTGTGRWAFDRIIFGMAPGGDVSVWASAMRLP